MNWQQQYLNITWEDFCATTSTLSQKITRSAKKFDLIVAIARGGLTLAQLMSDHLSLPIAAFTVQSYKDFKQASIHHIVYGLDTRLTGKKILLLDDVSDTGKTFLRSLIYLEELGARKVDITTAALHLKPHSTYVPDFYVTKTSAWIVYPYEVCETIVQLGPLWQKTGISREQIKHRFLTFGFATQTINMYLKKIGV